jgi:hypothetical protein
MPLRDAVRTALVQKRSRRYITDVDQSPVIATVGKAFSQRLTNQIVTANTLSTV